MYLKKIIVSFWFGAGLGGIAGQLRKRSLGYKGSEGMNVWNIVIMVYGLQAIPMLTLR